VSPESAQRSSLLLSCILCGACSEACPQVNERSPFVGAFLFAHVEALSTHPIGAFGGGAMLDSMLSRGGVADCAGAQACNAVCPKGIPLSETIARLELKTTLHGIKRLFQG